MDRAAAKQRERLTISRRNGMRQMIASARPYHSYCCVTPDELEQLLDAYEHGSFSTREPESDNG